MPLDQEPRKGRKADEPVKQGTPDHEPAPPPKKLGHEAAPKKKKPAPRKPADSQPAPEPGSARKVMNPTYLDARLALDKHFRREAEVAALMGKAASDGYEAFKIRSSAEYNTSGSIALTLFRAALEAVPAAASLAAAFKELTTGAMKAELFAEVTNKLRTANAVTRGAHRAHAAIERASKISEGIKHVTEAGEMAHEVGELGEDRTEARERGDFQIATIHSITELSAENLQQRWQAEDFVDALLGELEFSTDSVNLHEIVDGALQARTLPEPATLKSALREVADEFELRLYVAYYANAERMTYVTVDTEGVLTHHYEGLPDAVEQRFRKLGKFELVAKHTDEMRQDSRQKLWTGRRI